MQTVVQGSRFLELNGLLLFQDKQVVGTKFVCGLLGEDLVGSLADDFLPG